jgi:hypothetical protein
MTEHLPECPAPLCNDQCAGWECPHWCFCDGLRACEARVLREAQLRVAALRDPWPTSAPGTIKRSDALAAIKSGGWQSQ